MIIDKLIDDVNFTKDYTNFNPIIRECFKDDIMTLKSKLIKNNIQICNEFYFNNTDADNIEHKGILYCIETIKHYIIISLSFDYNNMYCYPGAKVHIKVIKA